MITVQIITLITQVSICHCVVVVLLIVIVMGMVCLGIMLPVNAHLFVGMELLELMSNVMMEIML